MFDLTGNTITITRGDTGFLNVGFTNGNTGNACEMSDGDKLTFTVKKKVKDDSFILQKVFNKGRIMIMPADTEAIKPGSYFYDIELRTAAGIVQTLGPYKFVVKYDLTH